ncbi:MAG: hypothetical protein QOH88_3451 [Verrucomicrobiota bacterium]|jgi:hypothetical protein
MNDTVLSNYRYDGKKFWHLNDETWLPISPRAVTFDLFMELGVTKKEARRLRDGIKEAEMESGDEAWREQVRWHKFIKGRQLYVWGGTIKFCNRRTGNATLSMEIAAFNEKLRRDFPSKSLVPENSAPATLIY